MQQNLFAKWLLSASLRGSLQRFVTAAPIVAGLIGTYLQVKPLPSSVNQDHFILVSALSISLFVLLVDLLYVHYANWRVEQGRVVSQNSIYHGRIRVVYGKSDLDRELYSSPKSVVQSATDWLVVSGSRSRDKKYLEHIENKVANSNLCYVRILIGPPQKPELKEHIDHLNRLSDALPNQYQEKIRIVETPYGGDWPERFICANDHKVVIITQSMNSPFAFDTGIVIEDELLAKQMLGQLKALAEGIKRQPRPRSP